MAGLMLQDEDLPAEIGSLAETQVEHGAKACLEPGESPEDAGNVTAYRTFDAPEPFPTIGAQSVVVTSTLHSSIERAGAELRCGAARASSAGIERLLQPGWHLASYEDLGAVEVGQERKVIHYAAVNAEGLVFLETYWVSFRRENVIAVLSIRAPLDNIGIRQFVSLAEKLDGRIQEGLRSLQ